MAPHSSTLAWKIPWMEEPGKLQSMGSLGVGHDWAPSLWLFTFMHWRRKWQPTPVFLLGESQGRGSLMGCPVSGVAQSRTRLKRLSSSSSSSSRLLLNPSTCLPSSPDGAMAKSLQCCSPSSQKSILKPGRSFRNANLITWPTRVGHQPQTGGFPSPWAASPALVSAMSPLVLHSQVWLHVRITWTTFTN